jgi:metal-responsive CopG/Arc/MetJ family transcriptional regulator
MKNQPKNQPRDINMGVRMTEDEVAELDKFAKRLKLSRSQLVRNLIICGIDDLRLAQTFGLISLINFIRQNNIQPQEIINLAMAKQGA